MKTLRNIGTHRVRQLSFLEKLSTVSFTSPIYLLLESRCVFHHHSNLQIRNHKSSFSRKSRLKLRHCKFDQLRVTVSVQDGWCDSDVTGASLTSVCSSCVIIVLWQLQGRMSLARSNSKRLHAESQKEFESLVDTVPLNAAFSAFFLF